MPAAVDAHALEHAHPLPCLEAHLGDMAKIVELRADAGHGTIGDDDPHAGSRSADSGSRRGLERRLVIDVGSANPAETPRDGTDGTPSTLVDRPYLERSSKRQALGGVVVLAGTGPQIGLLDPDFDRHRQRPVVSRHRLIPGIGLAQHRHFAGVRRGLRRDLPPGDEKPGGKHHRHDQQHTCDRRRGQPSGRGMRRPRGTPPRQGDRGLGGHRHGVSIHSLETRLWTVAFPAGDPSPAVRKAAADRAETQARRRGLGDLVYALWAGRGDGPPQVL